MSDETLCTFDEANPAVVRVTDLRDGDELLMCGLHFQSWVAEVGNTLFGATEPEPAATPTDPATGDETDEDEHADGQASEAGPLPEPLPPATLGIPAAVTGDADPYTVPVEQGGLNPVAVEDGPPPTFPPAGDGVHVNPVTFQSPATDSATV